MCRISISSFKTISISLFMMTAAWAMSAPATAATQTSAFTYQGQLKQSGSPVNGSVDLQFKLFDTANGGAQIGSTLAANAVVVTNGVFASSLDFGALAFNGEERWLEISVASPANAGTGPFTTLTPRQQLASTPYAAFALNALLPATYAEAVNFSNAGNTFTGSHGGNGSALTNLNPASLTSGTAGISITGNAATATTSGNVTGIVAVANGGTGASNAATARTNLGAAATSHTHAAADLTSGNLAIARLPTGGAWSLNAALNVDANTLVLDNVNNFVGVGVAAPERLLHVFAGESGATPSPGARILIEDDADHYLSLLAPNTEEIGVLFGNPTNGGAAGGVLFNSVGNANGLQFRTNTNDTKMIITSAGKVGIGTTTPTATLHVLGGDLATPVLNVQGAIDADVTLESGDASAGASNAGLLQLQGGFGVQSATGGNIRLFAGDSQSGSGGTVLLVGGDSTDGSGGDVTLRPGIGSAGVTGDIFLDGKTGVNRSPLANYLEVEGTASKSISGSWLANSDARIKTDIETVSFALDTLDRVRLASFRYTPEYLKAHPAIEDRRYLNVIAQEFAQVFPEHVKGSGEFLKSGEEILQVDIHPLTIYSAAAIQELHEKAKAQEKAIEMLQQQQLALEVGLSTLKDDVKDRDALIAELVERLAAVERFVRDAKNNPTPQ